MENTMIDYGKIILVWEKFEKKSIKTKKKTLKLNDFSNTWNGDSTLNRERNRGTDHQTHTHSAILYPFFDELHNRLKRKLCTISTEKRHLERK